MGKVSQALVPGLAGLTAYRECPKFDVWVGVVGSTEALYVLFVLRYYTNCTEVLCLLYWGTFGTYLI